MNTKDYFSFTRGEKRGATLLLIIIIFIIIGIQFIDYLKTNQQTDFSQFEKEINEFEKEIKSNSKEQNNNYSIDTSKIELFNFNPNTISDEEWKRLGFKDWQIKTLNNYKAKGGYWKTKEDVKKIYGLDEDYYKLLKPYILLPDKVKNSYNSKDAKSVNNKPNYFKFNPNIISKEQWKELGFNDWQIKNIFKYKEKGGSWKTKNDVKKIYGLSEADYYKLKPYILLPDNIPANENFDLKKDYHAKVNINTANAEELTKLKGIHSIKYAAIIIKYRNELGGFVKKEQLKEVWNLNEETYNGFSQQLELGNIQPKQININKASVDDLKKHPYINWNLSNAIVKYRKANGNYKKLEEIKKIHLISEETYIKISPYLTTN